MDGIELQVESAATGRRHRAWLNTPTGTVVEMVGGAVALAAPFSIVVTDPDKLGKAFSLAGRLFRRGYRGMKIERAWNAEPVVLEAGLWRPSNRETSPQTSEIPWE